MALKKNEFLKSSLKFSEGTSGWTNTTDLGQMGQAMGATSRLHLNAVMGSVSHAHALLMSLDLARLDA